MTGRALRLLGALVAVALAGCSTVPSSSPTVQITQEPARTAEAVGIEPLEPEEGATPEEIVRGFIDAAASTARNHPVARQYLTPEAAEAWSDEGTITVLAADYATVTASPGTVTVTADQVGSVDPRGVFSIGVQDYTRQFTLAEVDGEWRITDPPDDGLLMLQPDFERIYDQRAVYFVDPTLQRVVPDPRYLIQGDAQPTALVERLLAGPSPALAAGVRNLLSGATLVRSVSVAGQSVTVDLSGIADLTAPQLSVLCAQLVWTLQQLPGSPSVQLLVDGEPLRLDGLPEQQTVEDWSGFDPEKAPVGAVGHFLADGALRLVDGSPAPGPAGEGAYGLQSAAVSTDTRTGERSSMVGVTVRDGRAVLLRGSYGGDLEEVLAGEALTVPTVAATRNEFWTVRDYTDVVRVPAEGAPQPVDATSLAALGRASLLQLSPDGVRAAVIVNGNQLYVGTVVRAEDSPVTLRDLRPIAPSLVGVTDVAWAAADRLLVLASGGTEDGAPYSLGVDGWGLTPVATAGLPGQPTTIAAAPEQQPLISARGEMWQLSGGTWVTLQRGQPPVRGSEPFFPA
ncbi:MULTISPECIES: LpqB family beta-propeller domain-containing protein [unclassified Blastococcus]